MVVVVPGLAPGGNRQPGQVARLVVRVVVLTPEVVTKGVDAERRVVDQEDSCGAPPKQRGQSAGHGSGERDAQPERGGKPGEHPQYERAIHEADPRVGEQVLGITALVGDLHVAEYPPDVSVGETAERPAPSRAVSDMGAVRISVDVGELVMLAGRG